MEFSKDIKQLWGKMFGEDISQLFGSWLSHSWLLNLCAAAGNV